MYPGHHAITHPDRPAFIMASTGANVSFRDFEARSNQFAHLLRSHGLSNGDHYSIFMGNNDRYLETCAGGERTGMYYTCINSYLKADELAYILNHSESQILVTSAEKQAVVEEALIECPKVRVVLVVGGADAFTSEIAEDYATAIAPMATEPVENELLGTPMLYSSGTTGRPKGILRPLPEQPPAETLPVFAFLNQLWHYREDMIYLSPAPLYHSAPQAAVNLTLRNGGTVVIMERFDPLAYLKAIQEYQVTHSQLVPTMFSRMLKLPEEDRNRYDRSSLEIAIHAAAPCPVQVKHDMIKWWGPIIHEYYGATEAVGFTACNSEEWLAHPGTVGKVIMGDLHILDDDMNPLPTGEPGTMWFKTASPFEYFNDQDKTAESSSPDGSMTTVGDVGYLNDDGFLFLTDRKTFMIISGGVNIYPQETEDVLITHPKVYDAAVFGVPNVDLGEEVKALVQPMPGVDGDEALTAELLAFCTESLSKQKVPRSIDFEAELPRLPTGKLYKRQLRDRYWADGPNRLV